MDGSRKFAYTPAHRQAVAELLADRLDLADQVAQEVAFYLKEADEALPRSAYKKGATKLDKARALLNELATESPAAFEELAGRGLDGHELGKVLQGLEAAGEGCERHTGRGTPSKRRLKGLVLRLAVIWMDAHATKPPISWRNDHDSWDYGGFDRLVTLAFPEGPPTVGRQTLQDAIRLAKDGWRSLPPGSLPD